MSRTLGHITLLAGLLMTGLLACSKSPAADTERVALDAAIHRWMTAVNAQDAATLASTMTEDIVFMDDTTTVRGRDAAIRALREIVARGPLVATTRELEISNDVGWHVAGLAQTNKNGDVRALGQAIEIWKRVNGEWKLHRRMTGEAVPPGDSVTRPSTKEPVLDRAGE